MLGRIILIICSIFIFFGCSKGQSVSNVDSVFVGRKMLEAAASNVSSNATIVNINNCTLLYIRGITLTDVKGSYKIEVPKLKSEASSSCANGSALINLALPSASSDLSSFNLKFNFTLSGGMWQTTAFLTFKCTGKNCSSSDKEIPLNVQSWRAPLKFSYHCSQPKVETARKFNGTDKPILIIDKIQMQVFQFTTGGKFDAASDCTPYFTIPTLSVLMVSLILLLIVAYGISMISNIKTMDRFDDPKGKSLQIASSAD